MRSSILEALDEHSRVSDRGLDAGQLASTVGHRVFETFGAEEVPYLSGDVKIEIARMIGTTLRMAPNTELFIDTDHLQSSI